MYTHTRVHACVCTHTYVYVCLYDTYQHRADRHMKGM